MLVLSRKPREAILINTPGGIIRISVDRLTDQSARIGIEAPREYHVLREELVGRNAHESQAA